MEIKFSICPHDTAKGLEKWKIFVEKLEKKLGLNVDFQPFSSFAEEDIRLNQEFFHIYYSSPSKQVELLEKGYLPVAKFKG